MKNIKKLAVVAALAGLVTWGLIPSPRPAKASETPFDVFETPRTFTLGVNNIAASTGSTGVTNTWVDLSKAVGVAKIDIGVITNSVNTSNVLSVNIQVSPDTTNIYTLTNFALITTNTLVIRTNSYWGAGAITNTNFVLVPGQSVTPTASSAGFATAYLSYPGTLQYTNGCPISVFASGTAGANTNLEIGFNTASLGTNIYMRFAVTTTLMTNTAVSAFLTTPWRY